MVVNETCAMIQKDTFIIGVEQGIAFMMNYSQGLVYGGIAIGFAIGFTIGWLYGNKKAKR